MDKIFEEHTLRKKNLCTALEQDPAPVATTWSTILRPIASLHHIAPKSMGEGDEGEFQPLGYPLSITEITLALQIAAFLCVFGFGCGSHPLQSTLVIRSRFCKVTLYKIFIEPKKHPTRRYQDLPTTA